jgi:hypothetical protein
MPKIPSEPGPWCPDRTAETIRELVVPQVAPPYDDEPVLRQSIAHRVSRRDAASHRRDVPAGPAALHGPGVEGRAGEDAAARAGAWPGQFAQVLAETLAGSRPERQLAPWTTEQSRRQIRQLGPLFATRERPLVRRIMTTAPASGVLELTAVVGFGPRVRVLALRLERGRPGRSWCCTAIESA